MKRPSFQFYPGDWTGNSNLRRCTHAEKGVWLEVMCLMHDQEEYGVLRWPLKELAQAVGCSVGTLKSLVTKGVIKGDDKAIEEPYVYTPRSGRKLGEPVTLLDTQAGPVWYSSRMVKDEYVRTIRGESSRFGEGNDAASKATPKHASNSAPKPPFGDGSSSSSSSSTSLKDKTTLSGSPDDAPENSKRETAKTVLEYLNLKAGKAYRAVDANLDLIIARLKDGATQEQCQAVVNAKVSDWGDDAKMSEYLRPATLFNRTKFEQYLGEIHAGAGTDDEYAGAI